MGTGSSNLPLGHEKGGRFLLRLFETCDVEAAARSVDVHPARAYARRRVDPAFGRAWAEAMRQGADRVETALLARAVAAIASDAPPPAPTGHDQMLRLLAHRRQRMGAAPAAPGISDEQADAELLRLLAAVKARTSTEGEADAPSA